MHNQLDAYVVLDTANIIFRLTMQVAMNCFDKAARDSFRGQMKLSNR
jgi:hypothetical protein